MPHPVDIEVGKKIRQARWLKGMSQSDVADKVGIQFQQLQKYETAKNRVSCSRLVMIARALGVTPAYFFEDMGFVEAPKAEAVHDLTKRESRLVNDFRALPDGVQNRVEALVRSII